MALIPTIPTSFLPNSAEAPRRFRSDLTGAFDFLSYGVFAIIFLLALGVFSYGRILASNKAAKDAQIALKLAAIDVKTVEGFVRLRNRLTSSEILLGKHIAFSTFFSSLERILPSTVRFTELHLSLDATGVSRVQGTGIAKSFNTLAAASTAFAADGRIKDAIFSDITINKDSSVSFAFAATLEPEITAFLP